MITWSRAAALPVAALLLAACASNPAQRPELTRVQTAGAANLQLGIAYLQQNNLPLAKEKLERAEVLIPNDPTLQAALALLAERLDNEREAEQHYRRALRLGPGNLDTLNSFAVFLCRTGHAEEGVRHFQELSRNRLYRSPESALTNAGVCQRGVAKLDDAARSFNQALAVRPNHAEAAFQLADLELARQRTGEARAVVDRFLGAFRATPDLLLVGVRIARASGDRFAEERYARRLRAEFPDSEQLRQLSQLPPRKGG